MIDRQKLLSDLQALLKRLEADLLERSEAAEIPEVGGALRAEYDRAKQAGRTAQNYEDWRSDAITQAAAAWVLSCVFVRFLEDNQLIDPPRLAGPRDRLQRARDEHELFFRDHPTETDREYLLAVFDELAQLPGTKDVFGEHNGIRELPNWLSGDAAGELLRFFQKIDASTGDLIHDFTDSEWDTRFLGDLYQDLSEAARKKYALLQTPEFVEEFILDRTLEPALDEFGLDAPPVLDRQGTPMTEPGFRMIDPACGSGHFLLGAFPRILSRWQKQDPSGKIRDLVQRALDSIYGVDVNPFAVAITRFRLLLAALHISGVTKLSQAPAFETHIVCGDSLYHGIRKQQSLDAEWSPVAHHFRTENAHLLNDILRSAIYHCVVANPPYITPKDRAANQAYRKLYPKTCHMKYSLAVPFMERILQLALPATAAYQESDDSQAAGFTGQITANSFMKREFGKKLIESFFPRVDLTHVIDTSGAYIPGHGTPTVILFARSQKPVSNTIRTVMGIRGEPSTPDDPANGLVWSAILEQIDQPNSQSDFVSVGDSSRELFHQHPWSIGGGGAAELKEQLEEAATETLSARSASIGITSFTLEDDIFILPEWASRRHRLGEAHYREMVVGDSLRDWTKASCDVAVFPYDDDFNPIAEDSRHPSQRYLWIARNCLANNRMFGGKTKVECGLHWYEYGRLTAEKLRSPLSIVYAEVATHNHFVLDRGGKVFKQTAPVIKLPAEVSTADGGTRPVTEDDHLALLGLLNSSTACFWMKQGAHNKGDSTDNKGARTTGDAAFNTYAYNSTLLKKFPLPNDPPLVRSRNLDDLAQRLFTFSPEAILTRRREDATTDLESSSLGVFASLRETLESAHAQWELTRARMIALQEELDWECYRLYGLINEDLVFSVHSSQSGQNGSDDDEPTTEIALSLGERAFEIVLARSVATGKVQTTWFERHGSTPITELPADWPNDYRQLVERRIAVIESNPQIGLIEQPEYKRRWNTEPWDSQVERALRSWLLNRLEGYFDFDGRMHETQESDSGSGDAHEKPSATAVPLTDIQLVSVAKLADVARQDAAFLEVAELYRDDAAFDVDRLVEELVMGEHVPLLPVLRYKPSGLRKRKEWEQTWELQRQEDAIDARSQLPKDDPQYLTEEQARELKKQQIGDIPVPPKYKSSDFISTGGARYWALRGKLDVPKERWVSFPHCEGPDGTLVIAWAGYDHLQMARAISAYFVDIQERLGGRDDPRLVPLLACIIELLPWLKQWHSDLDPEYNQRMNEVFEGFVTEEAKNLGMTVEEIRAWEPPKKGAKGQRSRGAQGKKG